MRSSADLGRRTPTSRRRIVLIVGIALLVVLVLSLRSLAVLWTDQLWFSSVSLNNVFWSLLEIKIGLALSFGVFYFLVLFGNLLLTDRLGARDLSFDAEDEIVRRYQDLVRPYSRRIYAGISVVAGIFAGLTATGQWQNYLLFANAQSFGTKDPLFHKDLGFYIFRLPFISFMVSWMLGALISVIVITGIFHYLNGGIRAGRGLPRVSPQVKVHLSVLLAAVALVKAAGYVLARWHLVTSMNSYVEGAGYADVHARMPALTILFWLSLAAAVILLINIRNRGWSLPLLAIGLWAFVALVIGVIYPALLQTFKVTPAQSTLELPYIQRNIDATRTAFDISGAKLQTFNAATHITSAELRLAAPTLNNIRLWDPAPDIALTTVQKLQSVQGYYAFNALGVDRYEIGKNKKLTPVLIGSRQINSDNVPSPSWVNNHLVYTHGIGAAVLSANSFDKDGNPIFNVSNVPPVSNSGMPMLTTPGVYFGINLPGYVVANTKQKELDYKISTPGSNDSVPVESNYKGSGGIAIGGLVQRAAIALRFGDLNLLISNQITSNSRILFVRDIQAMAQKAAPFITWDAHPYPVLSDGKVKYVLDGYTTTDNYPYSQNASTLSVPPDTGLTSSFNYVRNSVKLVIDAYSGSMNFYAMDPSDPILKAYRAAFPNMFQPISSIAESIHTHLRYPQDIFSVQAGILGRYHIDQASSFYTASDRWEISPTSGSGSPTQALRVTTTHDAAGNVTSAHLSSMDPIYQVAALPNSLRQQLTLTDAFVPYGNSQTVQGLTAFMEATSDEDNYGKLNVYTTPIGKSIVSPVQADAFMSQATAVSKDITLLNTNGSHVLLGNNLLVPLNDTLLYIRPFYVTSSANSLPQLHYVIAVYNQNVAIAPTLQQALLEAFGGSGSVVGPSGGKNTVASDLRNATLAWGAAQSALQKGDLAGYQKNLAIMNHYVQLAQAALTGK